MMKLFFLPPFLLTACCLFLSLSLWAGGTSTDLSSDQKNDVQTNAETAINNSNHHQADELRGLLDGVMTLDAKFSQSVYSEEGDVVQQTSGHLQAARPGKVRWQSQPPIEQLIISNGETLWIYDPDLEQVSIRPFADDVSKTPAALFIGNLGNIEDSYNVTKAPESKLQSDINLFILKPVNTDNLYSQLALGFIKGTPVSMTLWDSLGQKTAITFTDVQLNQPIESILFEFEPPEGIDVIHNE